MFLVFSLLFSVIIDKTGFAKVDLTEVASITFEIPEDTNVFLFWQFQKTSFISINSEYDLPGDSPAFIDMQNFTLKIKSENKPKIILIWTLPNKLCGSVNYYLRGITKYTLRFDYVSQLENQICFFPNINGNENSVSFAYGTNATGASSFDVFSSESIRYNAPIASCQGFFCKTEFPSLSFMQLHMNNKHENDNISLFIDKLDGDNNENAEPYNIASIAEYNESGLVIRNLPNCHVSPFNDYMEPPVFHLFLYILTAVIMVIICIIHTIVLLHTTKQKNSVEQEMLLNSALSDRNNSYTPIQIVVPL